MANIVSPTEVIVVNSFHIELDGGGGDFHIAMPYSMLEPIRELLDAGVQSDKEDTDQRWSQALEDEIMDVPVDFTAKLLEKELSLREMIGLEAGDIIPVDMPESMLVSVEGLPTFRANLGQANNNLALKITERISRPEIQSSKLQLENLRKNQEKREPREIGE
jgi:flagellar motor switch protein FliM